MKWRIHLLNDIYRAQGYNPILTQLQPKEKNDLNRWLAHMAL